MTVLAEGSSAVSVITGAITGLQGDLLLIAGAGIGIGAVLFGVRKGWTVVRGFIK